MDSSQKYILENAYITTIDGNNKKWHLVDKGTHIFLHLFYMFTNEKVAFAYANKLFFMSFQLYAFYIDCLKTYLTISYHISDHIIPKR